MEYCDTSAKTPFVLTPFGSCQINGGTHTLDFLQTTLLLKLEVLPIWERLESREWPVPESKHNLRDFKDTVFHLSTNHLEIIREIYGLGRFVFLFLCIGAP